MSVQQFGSSSGCSGSVGSMNAVAVRDIPNANACCARINSLQRKQKRWGGNQTSSVLWMGLLTTMVLTMTPHHHHHDDGFVFVQSLSIPSGATTATRTVTRTENGGVKAISQPQKAKNQRKTINTVQQKQTSSKKSKITKKTKTNKNSNTIDVVQQQWDLGREEKNEEDEVDVFGMSIDGQNQRPFVSVSFVTRSNQPFVREKDFYASYYYEDELDDYDDDDENEEEDVDESVVSHVQQFRRVTGADVLDSQLREQIRAGPTDFVESLHKTTFPPPTNLERYAMSSVTEQLPQAAVDAFHQQSSSKTLSESSTTENGVQHAFNQRITREQEIELGRKIQAGVQLHQLRMQAEERLRAQHQPNAPGGDGSFDGLPAPDLDEDTTRLTRQEWAQLAGISTKELRRIVAEYRQAKHDLVTANMGLVHSVVNQLYFNKSNQFKSSGISREELVQEGSLGLLRAAELFDPDRGLRFSTYAVVWIKGVLTNTHIPELVRIPQREKTKYNKIIKAQQEIANMKSPSSKTNNNDPSLAMSSASSMEEVAALTGLTVREVSETMRRMQQSQNVLSLDFQYSTQSRSGTDLDKDDSATDKMMFNSNDRAFQDDVDLIERTQLRADVIAALAKNLDAREARLMRLRYGLADGVPPRTLQECADAMGISYTRAHQLANRCLEKLRHAAEAESLQEYLMTIA